MKACSCHYCGDVSTFLGFSRLPYGIEVNALSDGEPLERLAAATGACFPNLARARALTGERLVERRSRLSQLSHDDDTSIVLMGSWGRSELTSGSDDDYMVLVHGPKREKVHPDRLALEPILDKSPGMQGVFGEPVASVEMVGNIGLEDDSNSNLTRRMLFLLESVCATGCAVYGSVRQKLFDRYLDESVKDFSAPRFLLNDLIRYWRTVCVDFAGKERQGPGKWGLRNAKLRTSRKLLFASGLLPVLECSSLEVAEMRAFLDARMCMPPADRVAEAFLAHGAADAGGRALVAYDRFVGMLDDTSRRDELEAVTRSEAHDSPAFLEAKRLGKEIEQGLLALLFECEPFPQLVRDYAIF